MLASGLDCADTQYRPGAKARLTRGACVVFSTMALAATLALVAQAASADQNSPSPSNAGSEWVALSDSLASVRSEAEPGKETAAAEWEVIEYDVDEGAGGGASVDQQALREGKSEAGRLSDGFDAARLTSSHKPVSATAEERINVDMFMGEVNVFGEVKVSRVVVGNGSVVRAEVLASGELLVIGKEPGSSSLRLWHADGSQSDFNIRVSERDPETRVQMETMVRMKVRMVEFRKTALDKIGIDWSDSTSGPGMGVAGDAVGNNLFRPEGGIPELPNRVDPFATYFGIASQITSSINFLASSGDAVLLAEPVLSCANGGEASFLAGGEVPFPTTGENGQTVIDFKEYGIRLNVNPRVDALGNVQTAIETEISALDQASAVGESPGLLTRRASTTVNVPAGQTIVISGLLNSQQSSEADMIPGLGRLPIIGNFFRSRNGRDEVTELVIFVTPEVVDPVETSLTARQSEIFDKTGTVLDSAASQTIEILE